jgi:hypothetical protein
MDSTICFKQLSLEIENIKYLQEKKKKENSNLVIICDNLSNISIGTKKKSNKTKKYTENDNLLSIKFDGIRKKKIFKNISKYEIDLILKPKKKRMIPFEKFERESIIEIILKLPKLIEESCYHSVTETRALLPLNLNSLYKKSKSKLKLDNHQMYVNLKNHLLISIFIDTCKYLDNLKGLQCAKGYNYQNINDINDFNELPLIFNKKKVKQFNDNIQFIFYQINEDIIIDSENETYDDMDDYTRDGVKLLKLITPRIIKIIKKNDKIEDMKFKDRLDFMTMIFNFCCVIQYLLYRF